MSDNIPLAVALAAGVAVVLSAMMLGLAKVMDGDVRGRAAVSTEQIRAKAAVVTAFLGEAADTAATLEAPAEKKDVAAPTKPTLEDDLRVALGAYGDRLEIQTTDDWSFVRGVAWAKGGIRLRLQSGDNVDMSEVTAFRVTPEAAPAIDASD